MGQRGSWRPPGPRSPGRSPGAGRSFRRSWRRTCRGRKGSCYRRSSARSRRGPWRRCRGMGRCVAAMVKTSCCVILWPASSAPGGRVRPDGPGWAVSAVVTLSGDPDVVGAALVAPLSALGLDLVGVGVRVAGEPYNRACGLGALDGDSHAGQVVEAGGDQLGGRLGFRGGGGRIGGRGHGVSDGRGGGLVGALGGLFRGQPGLPWPCPARPGGPRIPPRRRPACPAARRGVRPRCPALSSGWVK